MQLIAMVTMLIDHIGVVFFPQEGLWRIIGRLAFPLYAYALVQGYRHTSSRRRYSMRLLWLGLLSQIPYSYVFDRLEVNVIGTLLVCLLVLILCDSSKFSLDMKILGVGLAVVLLEVIPFDYGSYSLLLVLIYRYARSGQQWMFHLLLNAAFAYYLGWWLQMFSILSTVLLVYFPLFMQWIERIKIPRWIWRSFYPVHLLALGLIMLFASN